MAFILFCVCVTITNRILSCRTWTRFIFLCSRRKTTHGPADKCAVFRAMTMYWYPSQMCFYWLSPPDPLSFQQHKQVESSFSWLLSPMCSISHQSRFCHFSLSSDLAAAWRFPRPSLIWCLQTNLLSSNDLPISHSFSALRMQPESQECFKIEPMICVWCIFFKKTKLKLTLKYITNPI